MRLCLSIGHAVLPQSHGTLTAHAEFPDRFEVPNPQQVLPGRLDEPLCAAIALGRPDESRRTLDAEECDPSASWALALSRGVASHIDQGVEGRRGDFCRIELLPRHLEISLEP
jgi:hypothetical protein